MVRKEILDMIEAEHGARLDAVKQRLADKDAEIERLNMQIPVIGDKLAKAWEENGKFKAEIESLREALESIANSTCCGDCQEAKRVAQSVLKEEYDD